MGVVMKPPWIIIKYLPDPDSYWLNNKKDIIIADYWFSLGLFTDVFNYGKLEYNIQKAQWHFMGVGKAP